MECTFINNFSLFGQDLLPCDPLTHNFGKVLNRSCTVGSLKSEEHLCFFYKRMRLIARVFPLLKNNRMEMSIRTRCKCLRPLDSVWTKKNLIIASFRPYIYVSTAQHCIKFATYFCNFSCSKKW